MNSCCMSKNLIVCNYVRFITSITTEALWTGTSSWSGCIATLAEQPWLVQSNPKFHPISKFLKAKILVVSKIISEKIIWKSSTTCNLINTLNLLGYEMETHTIWELKKPPYSSSKAWGRSQ